MTSHSKLNTKKLAFQSFLKRNEGFLSLTKVMKIKGTQQCLLNTFACIELLVYSNRYILSYCSYFVVISTGISCLVSMMEFFCENIERLLTVNTFRKRIKSFTQIYDEILNKHLISLIFILVTKIAKQNNMKDIYHILYAGGVYRTLRNI